MVHLYDVRSGTTVDVVVEFKYTISPVELRGVAQRGMRTVVIERA